MLALALCPIVALAMPPVEGTIGFVAAGQPQPCPPAGMEAGYTATIDFGDGTPVQPLVVDERTWLLGARHAYRRAGRYRVVATVTPATGGPPLVVGIPQVQIKNAPLSRAAAPRPAIGTARQTLARFVDGNRLAQAGDFTATVNGEPATVVRLGPGRFAVRGPAPAARLAVRVADDRGAKLAFTVAARR